MTDRTLLNTEPAEIIQRNDEHCMIFYGYTLAQSYTLQPGTEYTVVYMDYGWNKKHRAVRYKVARDIGVEEVKRRDLTPEECTYFDAMIASVG